MKFAGDVAEKKIEILMGSISRKSRGKASLVRLLIGQNLEDRKNYGTLSRGKSGGRKCRHVDLDTDVDA